MYKRSTKYKEINVCLLERKALNILRIFPKIVLLQIKFVWSMIKPFLTNKGHINGEEIILKCDNETITKSSVLAQMFNSHYINVVQKTSGKKAKSFCS